MTTLAETKRRIEADPQHGAVYLMDFVDDVRYYRDPAALAEPFPLSDERFDALLASTAESLCDEAGLDVPRWIARVPACRTPWFVSGIESLKAITLVESPLRFRMRKVFVLENFLSRV